MSENEEESPSIKTPKQLITVVLCAFVFPVTIIVLLTQYATGGISAGNVDPVLYKELLIQNRINVTRGDTSSRILSK